MSWYSKDAHPMMAKCRFKSNEWPRFAEALKYLVFHKLAYTQFKTKDQKTVLNEYIRTLHIDDLDSIDKVIILTEKGFNTVTDILRHEDNLRISRGLGVFTAIVAILTFGQFAIALEPGNVFDAFSMVVITIILIAIAGLWILRQEKLE